MSLRSSPPFQIHIHKTEASTSYFRFLIRLSPFPYGTLWLEWHFKLLQDLWIWPIGQRMYFRWFHTHFMEKKKKEEEDKVCILTTNTIFTGFKCRILAGNIGFEFNVSSTCFYVSVNWPLAKQQGAHAHEILLIKFIWWIRVFCTVMYQ